MFYAALGLYNIMAVMFQVVIDFLMRLHFYTTYMLLNAYVLLVYVLKHDLCVMNYSDVTFSQKLILTQYISG